MLHIDGRREPGVLTKAWCHLRFRLQLAVPVQVEVSGDGPSCRFVCTTRREFKRAVNLYGKEAGTIAWLQRELRPDDHFLDIGANIGVYTVYAARSLGTAGTVTAVEPHVVNAARLMDNIGVNGLGGRVSLLTCALADTSGIEYFYYRHADAGTSNSQLGRAYDSHGQPFEAAAREFKAVATVDELVATGRMLHPSLIKIDVDGIEPRVLEGMQEILTGADRPRSIQIEVGPQTLAGIESRLAEWGYQRQSEHYSKGGHRRLAAGEPRHSVSHNVIFAPGS